MKSRRSIFMAFIAVLVFVLASCGKEPVGTRLEGTGDLVLTISNLPPVTVTRTAREGDVMNTLSLWLVRDDVIVIHEHLLTRGEENDVDVTFNEDGKTAVMKFRDIERGNYTLYLAANYKDLDKGYYKEGVSIDDGFRNIVLDPVEDGKAPEFGEDGVPCSVAVDFSIGAGENKVSAQLLRCVARLTISVRNNIAGSSMFFRGVGLSKQNPTHAYAFEHENEIPAASKKVSFPEMTDFVRVDAQTEEPVMIYDTYLYETAPESEAEPFTFSLFGAVYRDDYSKDDLKIAYRKGYTFAENMTATATTSDMFLLRSAASENYYIGDVDGVLIYSFFSGDTELRNHRGIENYFWRFSSSSSSTITNVGTGRQVRLDGATASMVESGNGTVFSLISDRNVNGFRLVSGNYSLTIDPDLGIYGSTDKSTDLVTHWLFRKATEGHDNVVPYFVDAEYEIPLAPRTMTYIDRYGVAQTLRHIHRNEHVKLTIGVFYNRELGQFDFQIEPWNKKDSETTFD